MQRGKDFRTFANENIRPLNISIIMAFLTDEKLVIVGAAGMIGSNMVQTALMMGLTSNICLYDIFSPEGVAEEMRQSGFGDVKSRRRPMWPKHSRTPNILSRREAHPARRA